MQRFLQIRCLLIVLGLLVFSTEAQGQIRINEIGIAGVDFQGATKWVELYNPGDTEVDASTYWLCNFPAYQLISDLTVLEGAMTIPAGGYLVVTFPDLGDADAEVGLYSSNSFSSADAMVDYMQYGTAGHEREDVAEAAGVWTTGDFVPTPASGESISFLGTAFSAASWMNGAPSAGMTNGTDHDTADRAMIDRFSEDAGNLFVRTAENGLPEAGAPIDFDASFMTKGYGPVGNPVYYYNFDVQPTTPAPIYVLFHEGSDTPVPGQYNIVDAIPGDDGYNDFWQPFKVTVPAGYVANAITSADAITAAGYPMEALDVIVNCPVVPEGSTAEMRLDPESESGLVKGWYQGQAIFYFEFSEAPLAPDNGSVPVSPIYVTFNINPDQPDGGPPSGFLTEMDSDQTHNVVATVPGDEGYSPLWVVNIYDNAEFDMVSNLPTAEAATILAAGAALVNCPVTTVAGRDFETAERAMIDRFSEDAGALFVRTAENGLPEAGAPIDFDASFITRGFAPDGSPVSYYNFDVQPTTPAPIYVLFREGSDMPVEGQYNIVDVIPGDDGYNDFWQPFKVTVPANYVANAITSADAITAAGYPMEALDAIVNCPIVPDGSTASLRLNTENTTELVKGWYQDQAVFYFEFSEAPLTPDNGSVPVSPIYVTFNINPDQPDGGPPSGFVTEMDSDQTHNVVATVPGDEAYSPLWVVNIYDNAEFDLVSDLATAEAATILAAGAALVNCPIVTAEENVAIETLSDEVPSGFALHANFPNPFNPTTMIQYELAGAGEVTLKVFNMLGQEVAELVNLAQSSGVYQVQWDGRDHEGNVAASGVYLYRLTINNQESVSRLMTLLK